MGEELGEILEQKNGFLAFESALWVRGCGNQNGDLAVWNSDAGWRADFGCLADGVFFFGEDVFGCQFGIEGDRVVSFDPETGERRGMASSLEDWAGQVLSDYDLITGYPVARAWQEEFGPIPLGQRLVPKRPFVLGGDFSVDNVYAVEAEKGMRVRGELACQIRDLPDGAQVVYQVVD